MTMIIFGSAGHIDHGKTTLVKALTGIDADRLPEEKERGMTIDLGFAWMETGSKEKIGIIDVPGHENFIRNTIIGLTSVDAFILVVDAKEGWKPQTEEHFQIIRLLEVNKGIIIITKIDLVTENRVAEVRKEIESRIKELTLMEFPILSFSYKDTNSIHQIKKQIETISLSIPPKKDIGKPRLFIDRVFDIKGSGTVVTGTLINGHLYQNQSAYLFPLDRKVRLRQLQSYSQKVEKALIGSRVAINLPGIKKEELSRGDTIFGYPQFGRSKIIDVLLILPDQKDSFVLKNGTEVDFIAHTKILRGRIVFREKNLKPKGLSFAQIRFNEDVSFMTGDYYILRLSGLNKTIGGGKILDPLSSKYNRTRISWEDWLTKRKSIDIEQIILTEIEKYHSRKISQFLTNDPFSEQDINESLSLLSQKNDVIFLNQWIVDKEFWLEKKQRFLNILREYHQNNPYQSGFLAIQIKNHFPDLTDELFNSLIQDLVQIKEIRFKNGEISSFGYTVSISNEQQKVIQKMIKFIEANPQNLPNKKNLEDQFPKNFELIEYLIKSKDIIILEEEIVITPLIYQKMADQIVEYLQENKEITIGQVRDLLKISRKYIVPLLTRMDQEGITIREGNKRRIKVKQNNI